MLELCFLYKAVEMAYQLTVSAYIRKIILVLPLLCFSGLNAQTVMGTIVDQNGPLPGASVRIGQSELGAATSEDGEFKISNVPLGKHVLEVSFIGYNSRKVDINVTKGICDLGKIVLSEKGLALSEVEIIGKLSEGESKAILMERRSVNLAKVVSSEGIERLPDRNSAEALQRLPGVVMETDHGEGSFISFRGTPTDWGSALFNGDRLPVANEENRGRSVSFEILPTSFVEYIKYNQNLSPEIEGDAIGGSANLISKYVPAEKTLEIQVGGGNNFQAMKPVWNASILTGNRFGNKDQFGFVAGGSIYNRNWATDNYEIFYSNNNDHNIERLELRDYVGKRVTYGTHGKFVYSLNEKNNFYALGFYGRQDDMEFNRKTMYNWVAGVGQSIRIQNIHNKMINDISGFSLGGNHEVSENLSLEWKLARYETGFRYGPSGELKNQEKNGYNVIEYEKLVRYNDYLYLDTNGNRTDELNADTRLKLLDIDSPVPGYGTPAHDLRPNYDHVTAVKPEDTMFTHKKTYAELRRVYEKDPLVVSADAELNLSTDITLKFGGKARNKIGGRSYSMVSWVRDAERFTDNLIYRQSELQNIPRQATYLNAEGGHYQPYTEKFLTNRGMQNWISQNRDKLIYLPFGPKTTEVYKQFIGSNYNYDEQVFAGYGAIDVAIDQKLKLELGLRIEETNVSITALRSEDSTSFDPNTGAVLVDSWLENDFVSRRYASVLPMVNIDYEINEKSSIRSALTRSFRRPYFSEMKPGQPDIHYTHFHALYGNPDLRPTYSWNADLTYQRYFGVKGSFTLTGFYKYVTDHIYTAFRADELNLSGVSNAYRPPGGISAKEYKNAPYANVYGFEVTVKRQLNFLPLFFKNISIFANYAFTESAMRIESRDKLQPLPRQARNVVNLRLSYDDQKFHTNAALNFRDAYLMELNLIAVEDPLTGEPVIFNQNNDFDKFMGKSLGLDFSASYDISERFNIFLEANNLLNTPFVIFRGQRERPVQVEYYAQRALAGIKYKF